MNKLFITLFITLLLTIPSLIVVAQDITLKNRSAVEINFGLWGVKASNTISGAGVQSAAKTSGFTGGIGYSYWLREYLSVSVTAGLLSAQVNSTVNILTVTQETSSVIPLLLGIRFYIPYPEPGDDVRPFISAAVGTYIGSEAKNTVLSQEARSESAFGGRLGAGIDFLLGNHFKLNTQASYNLMSDFTNTIGTRKNYNGADFSLGVGYIF